MDTTFNNYMITILFAMKQRLYVFISLTLFILLVQAIPIHHHTAFAEETIDYWGVVIVSLSETLQPYIYNGLIQSENWDQDHIKLLWKQNATRENIFSALSWLQSSSDENDIVLFSVDCHGVYMDGTFGIWPQDGGANGMITIEELKYQFDKINAQGHCLIFDCCFSGNFADPTKNNLIQSINKREFEQSMQNGLEAENRVIIMGTMANGLGIHWADFDISGNQIVDISPSSILSECFISGNDLNNDGFTSAEESHQYLKEHFRKYALMGFLNIPLQIFCYLFYGFFTIPFPTLSDNYDGELPIVY